VVHHFLAAEAILTTNMDEKLNVYEYATIDLLNHFQDPLTAFLVRFAIYE
jgi:hypothetical protein